ncbi:MAG TPA: hypothetical protein VEW65_06945 [Chryseolinea sp.]|nr:hypothetical protein [Chryseolinea sp.]
MKTARISRAALGPLSIILIQFLYSCSDHEITVTPDYFPLSDNNSAQYQKQYLNTQDHTIWATHAVTLIVSGDTLIDGLTYKKIENEHGILEKVVRHEGSKYFGRNHELYGGFSKEYLFLDTSVPVNGTWEYIKDGGQTKTEYVVKEVNATHIVNGVEYKEVIKVEVNYYDSYTDGVNLEFRYSTKHYYANGVGEIYTYYPEQASNTFGSSLNITILPPSK